MRVVFSSTVLIVLFLTSSAQSEWIEYNKPYYKIKVAIKGIYHIPYNTLNRACYYKTMQVKRLKDKVKRLCSAPAITVESDLIVELDKMIKGAILN